jgi:hypothetical protein
MMRFTLLAACAFLGACTVVKINAGDTNTITHGPGDGVAENLANRACVKAGQHSAVIVSTVNKDAKLPPGQGKQVTTFRCSADLPRAEPPPGNEAAH